MKKIIAFIVGIPLILLGLYTILVMVRGPFTFDQMPTDHLPLVEEYEAPKGGYSIKLYKQNGAPSNVETSYIGALYRDGSFVRNVMWAQNQVTVEWSDSDTIQFSDGDTSDITLQVKEDTYDFRGFPF